MVLIPCRRRTRRRRAVWLLRHLRTLSSKAATNIFDAAGNGGQNRWAKALLRPCPPQSNFALAIVGPTGFHHRRAHSRDRWLWWGLP